MRSIALVAICVMLFTALTIAGCSGSSKPVENPVSPSLQTTSGESSRDNRSIWGFWNITVDRATLAVSAVPVGSVASHWNARRWLENGPCFNCLQVLDIEDMGDNVLKFQVELRHPYTNPNLTAFDVRGIAIFNEGWEFDESGLTVPTRGSGKGCLTNAEGYTQLYWNGSAGQGPNGLQGYSKGKYASVTEPTAELNGFMRHVSTGAANTRCALYVGDSVMREYLISMPEAPNPFVFGYAVDSSWAPPISKPVDDPMTDFGPDANCQEPWKIEAYVYPIGQGLDPGGSAKVLIDVYDHQGHESHANPVLECHQLFSGFVTSKLMTVYADHARYEARVKNSYAFPGIYKALITVTDYTNDTDKWWLPIKSYQIINLTVIEEQTDEGWAKTWGDVDFESAAGVKCDPWGNICVVGYFLGTIDLDPGFYEKEVTSNGATDVYLSVFDETGGFVWGLSFGGIGSDYANDVTVDNEGNIYIAGDFDGTTDFDADEVDSAEATSNGARDAFIVKYDRLGDFQWVRTWGGISDDSAGSISWAIWSGPPHPGSLVVGGSFRDTVKFWPEAASVTSHGLEDAYVLRYADDGEDPWCVTWGSDKQDFCSEVTAGMDSYAYAVGIFRNNNDDSGIDFNPGSGTDIHVSGGNADACLVKYNNYGLFVKAVHWGGVDVDIAYGMSGFVDESDDSIFVTGAFSGAVDFDPGVDEYWLGSTGAVDVYLTRFNLDLTHDWAYKWGGLEDDIGYDVDIDVNENPMVTGYFQGTCDLDPGTGTDEATSNGGKDIFISYFDKSGSWQWSRTWGGTLDDYAWDIATAEGPLFYVAGFFMDTGVEFAPCGDTDPHSAKGDEDTFLAKYLGDGCW